MLIVATAFLLIGGVTLVIGRWQLVPEPTWRSLALYLSAALLVFAACFAVAHVLLWRYLPDHDPFLLPTSALLTGWGLLLIGRLAINFLLRQMVWLIISTVALLVLVRLSHNLRWLRRFRYTWLFGGLALLAATLVLGVNPSGYGPRLWLGAWGVYFQPSEPLKLLMVVFLASYLAERRELLISEGQKVGRWRMPPLAYVGPLLAMFGLAVVLLVWQQDLGAAMLFFFTFLAMLYLATGQWGYVAAGLALFIGVGVAGYLSSDRVALRIDGWLNPWPEAADRAFQIVQSLLAFGAGGVFGQGLGLGSPTYIPAVHTDFAFAAIGEEFGLAGTLATVGLYGILMVRGFRAAARAVHPFERFLAAGLAAGWVIQAWVIMAGNAKLAPIAGVTLPFVSYGGSSLLTSFIALGLLLRVSSPISRPSSTSTVPSPAPEVKGEDIQAEQRVGELAIHPTRPITLLRVAGALTIALAILVIMCGYWAVVRARDLSARDDNPRRVLYEQRIVRGRILDREGIVLAGVEIAEDGTVTRRYQVPEAAPAVGYASLRYGTGGIEAAFDPELRGETGRSAWQVAWQELLHRPPQGRDLQLTLDAGLQSEAQRALAGHAGAVVLLDAASGEILALGSSPTFDPQALEDEWEALRENPAAPLVNRATQGLYQPGVALQTVVIAEALARDAIELSTPIGRPTAALAINGTQVSCSTSPAGATLGDAYAAGCPQPFPELGVELGASDMEAAVERWGLTSPPRLEIPTEAADWDPRAMSTTVALQAEAIGQGELTVSPLHMALVAATLANRGEMPVLRMADRVEDTQGGWREFSSAGTSQAVLARSEARALLAVWLDCGQDIAGHWGVAVAGEQRPPHAWFIGIAPRSGQKRYAIAVLVEHAESPETAARIGAKLLAATVAR